MSRKALSPVISSLILSAAVIVIGGAVWSYSVGAATSIADGYVNDTLNLSDEVTERFMVEHVDIDAGLDTLSVWVYNYCSQSITVDTYIKDGNIVIGSTLGSIIEKGDTSMITIEIIPRSSNDEVSIKIHSRRQNDTYETFYVP
ncbi:hypothetical protein HN807_10460 [Candidatus Bathyarchaeota archaeon]|nr:hypothetical protein [Candidatus Bathyarchaeota archaeon]MBT4321196.1 hypothetical protein [Candidatus Bathyarchaeota archaeon]MBT4423651.1 hypothetical protein [Candidatus Bathyarchaeota archaeon]MBT5642354.1 hypothetical protein [Candidatus Bathyarchaeota archaeon]MBT6605788.1 hypothetical protein [Candidatus Bathyarchaeota archaeon]